MTYGMESDDSAPVPRPAQPAAACSTHPLALELCALVLVVRSDAEVSVKASEVFRLAAEAAISAPSSGASIISVWLMLRQRQHHRQRRAFAEFRDYRKCASPGHRCMALLLMAEMAEDAEQGKT